MTLEVITLKTYIIMEQKLISTQWSTKSPGHLIILDDQSRTMGEKYFGNKNRAECAAEAINLCFNDLILANQNGEYVYPRSFNQIIGYGGEGGDSVKKLLEVFVALDGPAAFGIEKADLILANPPYLTKEEMESLQAEVGYEPSLALYGGEDGLVFYHGIAELWSPVLEQDGLIAVEIGEQQGESVAKIFADFSDNINVLKDYSGLPRVVVSGPSFFLTI